MHVLRYKANKVFLLEEKHSLSYFSKFNKVMWKRSIQCGEIISRLFGDLKPFRFKFVSSFVRIKVLLTKRGLYQPFRKQFHSI